MVKTGKLICTLDFGYRGMVPIKLKGLRLKMHQELCISDLGYAAISVMKWNVDHKTAKPKPEFIAKVLAEIHDHIPFDSIKINGYYHVSPEELMKMVREKQTPPTHDRRP